MQLPRKRGGYYCLLTAGGTVEAESTRRKGSVPRMPWVSPGQRLEQGGADRRWPSRGSCQRLPKAPPWVDFVGDVISCEWWHVGRADRADCDRRRTKPTRAVGPGEAPFGLLGLPEICSPGPAVTGARHWGLRWGVLRNKVLWSRDFAFLSLLSIRCISSRGCSTNTCWINELIRKSYTEPQLLQASAVLSEWSCSPATQRGVLGILLVSSRMKERRKRKWWLSGSETSGRGRGDLLIVQY